MATCRIRVWLPVVFAAVISGGQAMAQTSASSEARDFAMSVAQGDDYAAQAGWDALAESRNPAIRAFAQRMIDDHARSGESLRRAALASGLSPPPAAMGSDQARMLSALQSLSGAAFDRAFAHQQVLEDTQALAVAQRYAAAGADANLRKLAQSAVASGQRDLEAATQLRAALGGS